jgi:hypothetical protein
MVTPDGLIAVGIASPLLRYPIIRLDQVAANERGGFDSDLLDTAGLEVPIEEDSYQV